MLFSHKLFRFPFSLKETGVILGQIKQENIFEFRKIEDVGERLVEKAEMGDEPGLRRLVERNWEYIRYLEPDVIQAVLLCIKFK